MLDRLKEARRDECCSFTVVTSAATYFLGVADNWQGGACQQSPYIEDMDLLDETIVLRNPSVYSRDISGWKISDDNGCNTFHFPSNTIVEAGEALTVYCCAKGISLQHVKRPYIIWTNKDGSYRMKNVLNDGNVLYLLTSIFPV